MSSTGILTPPPATDAALPAPARRRLPRWLSPVLVLAALALYPLLFNTAAAQNIGVLALTYAIAATGWNVLGGYAGQVSFGHALYFGVGAYTTAVLVRDDWSPWLAIALALPLAAAAAVIIGYPTFRLRYHYYSIATIAVAEIVVVLVTNLPGLGQAGGLELPIEEPSLANLQFSLLDKRPYYYVAFGMFCVVALVTWLFLRGRVGTYVRAVRDDQVAAAAVGVPVHRYKLAAAALSGGITALAGGFYAMYVLFVDPPSALGLDLSVSFTLMAVLGGVGRFWGPLLGAWVLTAVQDVTRQHLSGSGRSIDLLLYGALIVVVAVVEPGGLLAILERVRRALGRWFGGAARRGREISA
ncbi:branched-chain amino acid ABC transporter permease [Micromonospora sp. NPDC049559]|uniref:branched-chain amino acid ABC transporter permease n=1 Tax=Micromonospora sp. NPDC049559 TaxID=3155923 RepID=UPI003437F910